MCDDITTPNFVNHHVLIIREGVASCEGPNPDVYSGSTSWAGADTAGQLRCTAPRLPVLYLLLSYCTVVLLRVRRTYHTWCQNLLRSIPTTNGMHDLFCVELEQFVHTWCRCCHVAPGNAGKTSPCSGSKHHAQNSEVRYTSMRTATRHTSTWIPAVRQAARTLKRSLPAPRS